MSFENEILHRSGPNLDKKSIQLSEAAPPQKNYFVVKPLKKF